MTGNNEVLSFIKKFQTAETVQVFTNGCCYWFAFILCERFKKAIMMYDPVMNHYVAKISGRLYDITGDVTNEYNASPWSEFDDSLEKERLEKNCINFTD